MKIAIVKFAPWDKDYFFATGELDLEKGDRVIVDTEFGEELGTVVQIREKQDIKEFEKNEGEDKTQDDLSELKPVIRKAKAEDLSTMPDEKEKQKALDFCRHTAGKRGLEMKIVDVLFSFSGNRITFAFIADGRVDFRELVKDLTSHFNKIIRLTQIGIRDEARICGDCGHCGRELCCRRFINNFESITSEMAETQQVVHRGSDRISGVCGRLMCCLYYEQQGYKELAEKMPDIGQRVNVDGKRGTVVNIHVLKQSVDVEFDDKKDGNLIVEVDLNRNQNKEEQDSSL